MRGIRADSMFIVQLDHISLAVSKAQPSTKNLSGKQAPN